MKAVQLDQSRHVLLGPVNNEIDFGLFGSCRRHEFELVNNLDDVKAWFGYCSFVSRKLSSELMSADDRFKSVGLVNQEELLFQGLKFGELALVVLCALLRSSIVLQLLLKMPDFLSNSEELASDNGLLRFL
jgi:hypothetical protein